MITINSIDYLTTKEVSVLLNVHVKTVNYYVKLKKLIPFRPTPRKLLFTKEMVINFVQNRNSEDLKF